MRSTPDRIRHTVLFEAIAIVLTTLIAVLILNKPILTIGSLALTLSLLAMFCNYSYNLAFDRIRQKYFAELSPNSRTLKVRLLHAAGFEGCFIALSLPVIACWLNISLWQALLMDIGFAIFFLIYALIYNWIYDWAFPVIPRNPGK